VRRDAAALVDSARTVYIEHPDIHDPEAAHEPAEGETQSTLNVAAYFLVKV
jgi:hypothetical protein